MPRRAPHPTTGSPSDGDAPSRIDALLDAWTAGDGAPADVFWGAVCAEALGHVAAGRLVPVVDPGRTGWRVGPLDGAALDRVDALADAMPDGTDDGARPAPATRTDRVRAAMDTVATVWVRRSAAIAGAPEGPARLLVEAGASDAPTEDPDRDDLAAWAHDVAALLDPRVTVSLRLEPLPGSVDGDRSPVEGARRPAEGDADLPDVDAPTDDDLASRDWLATVVVRGRDGARTADELWASARTDPGAREAIGDVLVRLRAGAHAWPALDGLLDQPVPGALVLAPADVRELLAEGAAALGASGIEVEWPASLAGQVRSVAVFSPTEAPAGPAGALPALLRLGAHGGASASSGSLSSPMTLTHDLTLDGVRLTAAEREHLARVHAEGRSAVVRLRGRWVLADPAATQAATRRTSQPVSAFDAVAAALTGVVRAGDQDLVVTPTPWLDRLRAELEDPAPARDVVVPDGLDASLRDYQLDGLRWLARLTGLGLGACLADDMGLGKTITLIALHLHRSRPDGAGRPSAVGADTGPTLVVCPASLLGNWEQEIRRFAPGVAVRRFHGASRDLRGVDDGFVLTTYGTVLSDSSRSAPVLGAHRWGLVVADEAQHVKNPGSGTAKALRTIPAEARVALSGTPVENNLTELWAVMDWLNPGLLGTRGQFRRRWADPIEGTRDPVLAERLSRLVRPFLLRRRKSDPGIAPELPPKTVTDQVVPLTAEQVGLYEDAVRSALEDIDRAEGMGRRAMIGGLLTHLKQICNHPAQYLHEEDPRLAGRSGKLDAFTELVTTVRAEEGAILVFTQYVAMARLLESYLARRGVPTMLLHGGTPVAQREQMVARFQATEAMPPVFLLSLKAAGTGLNLTRADHVIHFDRWWNPAVEEQATDRAYRIGQTRPVQVHRLTSEGTIEEHIARMIESKRELADAVLGAGGVEGAISELSTTELAELVSLRSADGDVLTEGEGRSTGGDERGRP
ncbi:SNF2-related protein [Oerskovia jenensis]|uniref:Superfamily II DNA or RNA helicase n=1 Tax=Oerskovia jenensis TaxID=162169 RepID=A0ABS2LEB4_9CELL|nr:SNF2-related protein [Oerskovia jenensis]MBM7478687.1 superfamily II DNA or RNA helicase [Oerskovia jenensis]